MLETVLGGLTSTTGFAEERRANGSKKWRKTRAGVACSIVTKATYGRGVYCGSQLGGSVRYSKEGIPAGAPEVGHMVAQSGSRERLNTAAQFHFSFSFRSWVPAHRMVHFFTAIEIFYIYGVPLPPANLMRTLTDTPRDYFHSDVQSCHVNNQDWPFQY